jgi:hypothetical protein
MTGIPDCRWLISLLLCSVLLGCGGNTSHNNQGPPMLFESGLHSMSASSSTDPTGSFVLVGSLMQNGSSLSGIMHFQGSPCFPFATDIPVNGTLTPSEADLTAMLPNGQKVTFSGMTHPGGHLTFLNGNYSVTGSGCIANVQGTAGDGAMDFSGHYIGHFVSSTGNSASVSLSLNQTGPDAHGLFSATGTVSITGGTCFSSATLDATTLLLGKGSTLVLDDSAVGSAGKTVGNGDFSPPSPVGFPFFNGTYTSSKGACSETGALNLAFG